MREFLSAAWAVAEAWLMVGALLVLIGLLFSLLPLWASAALLVVALFVFCTLLVMDERSGS